MKCNMRCVSRRICNMRPHHPLLAMCVFFFGGHIISRWLGDRGNEVSVLKAAMTDPHKQNIDAQGVVDYIARALTVKYQVLSNNGSCHGQFVLKNTMSQHISTEVGWSIFFFHLSHFKGNDGQMAEDPMAWRSIDIAEGAAKICHVQGSLWELIPSPAYIPMIASGETVTLEFVAARSVLARTDMKPNWYVTAPNARPAVLRCTAGEKLDFINTLDGEQLKRTTDDRNMPWTPAERFERNPPRKTLLQPTLVPTPSEIIVEPISTKIAFSRQWSIRHSERFKTEAHLLSEILEIPVNNNTLDEVFFVSFDHDKDLASEAYSIECSERSVTIKASTPTGAFYAVISVQNLLDTRAKPYQISSLKLHDAPRFEYRGLMLDVSRNFFPPGVVMRLMDAMAMYKLNKLHLHLTDDEGWRLEIPGLPELTEIGGRREHDLDELRGILPQLGSGPFPNTVGSGYYSVSQYQELLRYANSKHIEVIPEIDIPGHSHAAIKAMEARHLKLMREKKQEEAEEMLLSDPLDLSEYSSPQSFTDGAMNPCMASTYRFVEFVLDALIKMHQDVQPLKVFHFGGDELPDGAFLGSHKCMEFTRQHPDMKTTAALKQHFVKEIGKMVAQKGLKLQGWNDGFKGDKNIPFDRSQFNNSEVFSNMWLNMASHYTTDNAYIMANDGYKVILSYATHLYFDHPQEPDFEERGLYWATRFIDTQRVYQLITNNIYAAEEVNTSGFPRKYDPWMLFAVDKHVMLKAPENIVGLQAELWTETVRTEDQLFSMLLPRLVALAERAWHPVTWENADDLETPINKEARTEAWITFANTLGAREIQRLTDAGFNVHLPPPGAQDMGNGKVAVNCAFPGLTIEYSEDGREWLTAEDYTISNPQQKTLLLRTRSRSSINKDNISRVVTMTY